ncbi:MAG: SpoIIE family protein phosphatase [Anaerolineae bacterium]|nr:SpoIIE family protein phosphatase [Anaerolineae bacterium]NUQ02814.1 SpoIIE family protein phosphatase [Anaerolineae bacterium]
MTERINRLLVVDDNAENREIYARHFRDAGIDVEIAEDGRQAWDILCMRDFDLVITGANLPGLSGEQLLQAMKVDDRLTGIPVLVVSSVSNVEMVSRMIDIGADDYVQEPVSSQSLDLRVRIVMLKKQLKQREHSHLERVEKMARMMEEVILPMGIALSTETDFDHLLERIVNEARSICRADAGSVYIRTNENTLRFAIVITESLGIHLGGSSGKVVNFAPLPLFDRATGQPNHHNVATYVTHSGRSINIPDIYTAEGFDFSATKIFDKQNNYRSISSLTVPLKDNNGNVIGVLQLLNAKDEEGAIIPFDEFYRLVVESLSSQAAVVLNNHLLVQHRQKMAKIENDIQIARRIQTNFLPNTLPVVPGWELGGRFQPARDVAGDFYDFFLMMNDRRLGIIIADVCDKGVGAALFMSLTRSLLRAFAMQAHNVNWAESLFEMEDPRATLRTVGGRLAIRANALKTAVVNTNEYITQHHLDLNMFATMFFGMLDPTNGTLVYINGGHPPPMIIAPDGTIRARLEPTGPAVGMFPGAEFELNEYKMEPGDMFYGFTDGVTDARNPAGKLFKEDGLIKLISPPLPSAASLLDRVDSALYNYISDAVQFDDITMVAARYLPEQTE